MNCAALQIPIGLEADMLGLVDLVHRRAFHFQGPNGDIVAEASKKMGVV